MMRMRPIHLPSTSSTQQLACRCASTSSFSPPPGSNRGPSEEVRQTAQTLLPPIQLYRRLLRAHRRHLHADMRTLGDKYIRDEFRQHRKVDNPLHIVGFLSQWKLYLDAMEIGEHQPGAAASEQGLPQNSAISAASSRYFEGRRLNPDTMEKVSHLSCLLMATSSLILVNSMTADGRAALPALRANASHTRNVRPSQGASKASF